MSNQNHYKLPRGCLIAVDIALMICGGTFFVYVFAGMFTPVLSLDSKSNTSAGQALDLTTESDSSFTAATAFTALPTDTQAPVVLPANTLIPPPTTTRGFIPVTGVTCLPDNPPQTGRVLDIVDGDTIVVVLDQDGKAYSVRYIGMDAPENTGKIEPFGLEAAEKNRDLTYGKTVSLIKDVSETDGLGRLLRYVIADGIFLNYELVAQGYAKVASFPEDIACISEFQAAEKQASAWKLGVWGEPLPSTPLPTGASFSGASPVCSCSGNLYNCSDFSTHASAQACYNFCQSVGRGDIHRLDGDNDSSACEDLPR